MPRLSATPNPARLVMQMRTIHTYIGVVIAPAMLFFSITGLVQVYDLHEAHGDYTPAPIIEKLGMVHKNQRFNLGRRGPPDAEKPSRPERQVKPEKAERGPPGGRRRALATALLKLFFTAASVGLLLSTIIGVWMALRQKAKRALYLILLAIGAFVPMILAALTA